ncbi:DUF2780 domain-containing protein [Methylomonas koyamae]|uniref:DUF2780 domain-containing protein n=1 Tax=Methylomonas koyamae TaxID=702114 RepID=UPI0028734C2A|nr:DUF2780 domain-containing protein [Methylomonas koyamae]WNB74627.1 DUF2780 domain-containing protein [Methylomonas koyamae]
MKHMNIYRAAWAALVLGACAPVQQPTGQTFALGGAQNGVFQQAPAAIGSTGAAVAGIGNELSLINILVGQLGISPQQALGGVGSIFSVAQQRMNPGDFSQLSGSVPGMDRYLSSAPQLPANGANAGLLGAAGSLLGGQNNALGSLAALAGSFQNLGMNPSMVGQFVPVVLQYVQNQGGAGAMNLLQSALR